MKRTRPTIWVDGETDLLRQKPNGDVVIVQVRCDPLQAAQLAMALINYLADGSEDQLFTVIDYARNWIENAAEEKNVAEPVDVPATD